MNFGVAPLHQVKYAPFPNGNALPSFDNSPHALGAIFFFSPPPEIGSITNAYTTLDQDTTFTSPMISNVVKLIAFLVGLFCGYLLGDGFNFDFWGRLISLVLFGGLGFIFVDIFLSKKS